MIQNKIFGIIGTLWVLNLQAASIQNQIDTMINKIDPNINLGMEVMDLNTQTIIYQRRAQQLFVPASNMKLFSEASALLFLGPDYQFENQLTTNAPQLENGTLKGSIYLHLSGDPSFNHKNLYALFEKLSTLGVQHIQGNVVINSSLSNITQPTLGVVAKDFNYSYGAPVGPLIIDENQLHIIINPGASVGKPAIVEYTVPQNVIKLNNKVVTASTPKGCGVQFQIDANNQLTLNGCIGINQAAIQQHIAIRNPLSYLSALIKNQLAKEHIQLDGQVILSQIAHKPALIIAKQKSKHLSQLMSDTLKPSDNVYADSIYLHTASKISGHNVNWQQAGDAVKQFLQKTTGISFQNAVFSDGSGLSRNNRVTPDQTLKLLKYMYINFPLTYEYIAALPISGQDGTLQRRFKREHHRGLIRAKTGTMTGISSLSGYMHATNGHTLAFTMYINTLPGTKPSVSGKYRSLVEQICNFLIRQNSDKKTGYNLKSLFHIPFHNKPSHAEQMHQKQAKWRRLEYALKNSLKNQPVTVLFHNQELVLIDHNAQVNKVWHILEKIRQKHAFSVVLNGSVAPDSKQQPTLLWINNKTTSMQRIWTLRNELDEKRS